MDTDSFSLSFSLFPLTCVPLSAGSSGWRADWLPAVCGGVVSPALSRSLSAASCDWLAGDGCWFSLSLSAGCCGCEGVGTVSLLVTPTLYITLQVGVTGRCGLEAGVRVSHFNCHVPLQTNLHILYIILTTFTHNYIACFTQS
jgi:hypothetical protein